MSEQPQNASNPPSNQNKKSLIIGFTVSIPVIAVVIFLWWLIWGRFDNSTDDAYVNGNMVRLTPQISGIVVSINADDTQIVEEGQILIELDKTDYIIALDLAKANLGETIRKVTQMFENVYVIASQFEAQQANCANAQMQYDDRKEVVDTGAVSEEDFVQAETNYYASVSNLKAIKYELMRAISLVQNTTVSTHPLVVRAAEDVKQAFVNLERCTLRSPATGMIAQRGVQVGESVAPNMPLLAVIPLEQMWVDANFKEIDLSTIRIGQPARLISDMYGRKVVYIGRVIGINGGSGAVFSPLPPQNATGNWIKIVQRIPVRISINPDQLRRYPLWLGLSMTAHIDVSDEGGERIPEKSKEKPIYQTDIFKNQIVGSDVIIDQIMQENMTFDLTLSGEVLGLLER